MKNKQKVNANVNANDCRTSYYQSVQVMTHAKEPAQQESSKSSEIKKRDGSLSRRRSPVRSPRRKSSSSSIIQRKQQQPVPECNNPYYRSVQKLSITDEENEVVIFGRPPIAPESRRRLNNKEHDDDLTTLITASETATMVSAEEEDSQAASQSNMTDTVQSGGNDYQASLSVIDSPTRAYNDTDASTSTDSGDIVVDTGLYKLCPAVQVRVRKIEGGSSVAKCQDSSDTVVVDKRLAGGNADMQQENAHEMHEVTSESVASDRVVKSVILGGYEMQSPKIPKNICFPNAKQLQYTSLRDLMVQEQACAPAATGGAGREDLDNCCCERPRDGASSVNSNEQDHDHDGKLQGEVSCLLVELQETSCSGQSVIEEDLNLTSPALLVGNAVDHARFDPTSENDGRTISPVKAISNCFDENESVNSSVILVRNDIEVGTITNLNVFRKEKCEDDECNFGNLDLFGKVRNKVDECKCTIM